MNINSVYAAACALRQAQGTSGAPPEPVEGDAPPMAVRGDFEESPLPIPYSPLPART